MKPLLITTLLVLAVCIGCRGKEIKITPPLTKLDDSTFATMEVDTAHVMKFDVYINNHSNIATRDSYGKWEINGRIDSVLEYMYREWKKCNDRIYIKAYRTRTIDTVTVVDPKPSPIPDTTPTRRTSALAAIGIGSSIDFQIDSDTLPDKKIKNLDKMKPRWTDVDTIRTYSSSGTYLGMGVADKWLDPSNAEKGGFTITPYKPIYDTLKAIFLVSDTSAIGGFRSQRAYWIKGYFLWTDNILGYLDGNKLPLKQSIVVWISKPVKE